MNRIAFVTATALFMAGCTGMSDTQQRVLTGSAGGATAGAVLGAIGGDAALGAVAGASAGMLGGMLYDYHKQSEERAYAKGRADAARSASPRT
jgi:Glycine zipper